MRQFLEVKERYPEAIVFFRLGDFYEMFFDDAVVAAKLLDVTLTTRDKGHADAVPMCGVPHHAARGYIAKLTERGYSVVLCDQVEDAKQAKGLVKRAVVRVVTPGITLDDDSLTAGQSHYVAAVVGEADGYGLAYVDVSTGEFRATVAADANLLWDELMRVAPREIVADRTALAGERGPGALAPMARRVKATWTPVTVPDVRAGRALLGDWLTPTAPSVLARAAGAVLAYARSTQPIGALPVTGLAPYAIGDAVVLDDAAICNLELVTTLAGKPGRGTLLEVIDRTVTAPGARCLRRWLLYPLTEVAAIEARLAAVAWLVGHARARGAAREALADAFDLERLLGKVTLGVVTPRELARLGRTLAQLPRVRAALAEAAPALLATDAFAHPAVTALAAQIAATLADDPPLAHKDGGYIRDGFDAVVDANRRLAAGAKVEVDAIETREQARTGIPSLKVRFNRVFGYYLEITKSHLAKVPADYVRKQTVASGERFVTDELAVLERAVLAAEETLLAREAALFASLVGAVRAQLATVATAARRLAEVDALASLAEVAHARGFVQPTLDDGCRLDIVDGRHPVVEQMLEAGEFVPNDCVLASDGPQLVLLTGPNMAGKSTYMRQVAHIVLLAQVGSFVPARAAHIGVCDRLFTRVGASDNLARGESTFMVEMRETSAILAGATARSLVILDEVGRGTSTFDGVSIAWAVGEYLHDVLGARTLFATHYHELTALAVGRPRVELRTMVVREQHGRIVFARRVERGAASRSYGIEVAKLAGLPDVVIRRARAVLAQLEGGAPGPMLPADPAHVQPTLMPTGDPGAAAVAEALRQVDPLQLTPMAALALVAQWRSTVDTAR